MTLFPRLHAVIAATLKIDPSALGPQSSSEDFPAQWDSMGQVNLIMALEDAFGLFIEPEDFGSLKSVAAIEAYLRQAGVAA